MLRSVLISHFVVVVVEQVEEGEGVNPLDMGKGKKTSQDRDLSNDDHA